MFVRQWVENPRPFTDKWAGFFFVFWFSLLVLTSMRQPLEDVCSVIFVPWCLSLKWGTEVKIFVETGNLQQCKTVGLGFFFLFLWCVWLINDDQQASLIVQLFFETIAVDLFFCDLNVNPINFYYFLKIVFSHPSFHYYQLFSYSFKYF